MNQPSGIPQHRRAPARRARGAALLEALLALAVFAIAVVGLAKSLNAAALYAREARVVSTVTRSMENALEEAIHRPIIEPGEWTSEPDANGLIVTTRITEVEIENQAGQMLHGMYEVIVIGLLPGRAREENRLWELRTLCYPPLYAGTR
jgi:hypothetical protein